MSLFCLPSWQRHVLVITPYIFFSTRVVLVCLFLQPEKHYPRWSKRRKASYPANFINLVNTAKTWTVSLQLSLEKRDYADKLFGNYNYHRFIKLPLANVLLGATAIAQWRQPADNRFDYYRLFLICVTRPPALLPPQMTISHDNRFYPGFCLCAILS